MYQTTGNMCHRMSSYAFSTFLLHLDWKLDKGRLIYCKRLQWNIFRVFQFHFHQMTYLLLYFTFVKICMQIPESISVVYKIKSADLNFKSSIQFDYVPILYFCTLWVIKYYSLSNFVRPLPQYNLCYVVIFNNTYTHQKYHNSHQTV